jgi:hypothetical protein
VSRAVRSCVRLVVLMVAFTMVAGVALIPVAASMEALGDAADRQTGSASALARLLAPRRATP